MEELRDLINKSGIIHYERDIAFDVWNKTEKHLIKKVLKGDYLSAKATDYEKDYKGMNYSFDTIFV